MASKFELESVSVESPAVLSAFLPKIHATFARRRVERANLLADALEAETGFTPEEFAGLVDGDEALSDLVERAVGAAIGQRETDHIAAIARVVAQAINGDTARIDISVAIVDAIAAMQWSQARMLVEVRKLCADPLKQSIVRGATNMGHIGEAVGLSVQVAGPLLQQLEAQGLVKGEPQRGFIGGSNEPAYSITEFGDQVLDYLV